MSGNSGKSNLVLNSPQGQFNIFIGSRLFDVEVSSVAGSDEPPCHAVPLSPGSLFIKTCCLLCCVFIYKAELQFKYFDSGRAILLAKFKDLTCVGLTCNFKLWTARTRVISTSREFPEIIPEGVTPASSPEEKASFPVEVFPADSDCEQFSSRQPPSSQPPPKMFPAAASE